MGCEALPYTRSSMVFAASIRWGSVAFSSSTVRTSICTAARAAACSSSCALCAQAASASGAGERRACPLRPRPAAAKPERARAALPPFGFAAQNRARHFAARDPPVRPSASRPRLRRPAPLFCCCRFLQFSRSYARLLVFNSVLLRKNRRSRSLPPLGQRAPSPFSLCSNVAPRSHPGPPRFQLGFCCAKTGAAGYRPHLLGLPRKSGRGISLRETTLCGCPLRGHGFATPHRYFAVPVTAAPRRVPNGKTPALAPIRSHFACGETAAGRCPAGATCSLPHFRSAQMWPRARTPALLVFNSVLLRKTGGRVPPLSDGGALTKSENIILCASSCHPPRSPYPHCTLPHVRFSGIGQKKKPQRKTAAAVNTLYMSCKKTSVNPISFPVALCTKISPFKAIHLLSQCKTKIQFLWMRMRKRSAN